MRNIGLQQFFAVAIAEHADQGVVDFDETAIWSGEEKSFLNVVEQLAITAFRFAPVGDVFQHVDGLQAFAVRAVNPRSGDQVSALQHRDGRIRPCSHR